MEIDKPLDLQVLTMEKDKEAKRNNVGLATKIVSVCVTKK